MGTFLETQCIYQTVQYFIKTGVLHITAYKKYSLQSFSVMNTEYTNFSDDVHFFPCISFTRNSTMAERPRELDRRF